MARQKHRMAMLAPLLQLALATGFVWGGDIPSFVPLLDSSERNNSQALGSTWTNYAAAAVSRRSIPDSCGRAVAIVYFETPPAASGLPAHLREVLAQEVCPTILALAEYSASPSAINCCHAAEPETAPTGFAIQLHSSSSSSSSSSDPVGTGGSPLPPPPTSIDSDSLCSTFAAIAGALDTNQIIADVLGVAFKGTKVEVPTGTSYANALSAASCPHFRGRITGSSSNSLMSASVIKQEGGISSLPQAFSSSSGMMEGVHPPWLAVHSENGQAGVESSPAPVFGIPGVYEGTLIVPMRASGLLAVSESATANPFETNVGTTYFPSPIAAAVLAGAAESANEDVLTVSDLRDASSDDIIVGIKAQSVVPTLLNTAVISGTAATSPMAVAAITASGDTVKLPTAGRLMCTSFAPALIQTDANCNLVLESNAEAGAEEASISVVYTEPSGKTFQVVVSVRILYPELVRLSTGKEALRPISRQVDASAVELTSSANETDAYADDDTQEEECSATQLFERVAVKAVAHFRSGDATASREGDHDVVELDVTKLALPFLTVSNPDVAKVVDGWIVGKAVGRSYIVRRDDIGRIISTGVEWAACSISVVAAPAIEVVGLEARVLNDADLRVSTSGVSVSAGILRYFYTVTVSPTSLSASRRSVDLVINAVLEDGSRLPLTTQSGLVVNSDDTLAVDVVTRGSTFALEMPVVALTNPAVRIDAVWSVPGCNEDSASLTHTATLLMEVASLINGYNLPELRLTSTRQKLSNGKSMRSGGADLDESIAGPTAGLPVFSVLSLVLTQNGDVSKELSENPSIEISTNVIAGAAALVTIVDNMVFANTEGRTGTVVVSAFIRGRTDIAVAQVTIDVFARDDPRWALLSLTKPAESIMVESQGPSANDAAFAAWTAGNGNAIAYADEVNDGGGNADTISWVHHVGEKSLLDPSMAMCDSWSQTVRFIATHKSAFTGEVAVAETSAVYTLIDTDAPVFRTEPASKTVSAKSGNEQTILSEWQAGHGGGAAFDAGSGSNDGVRWTWTTAAIAVNDTALWTAGCSETYRTTFKVEDTCGNTATAVADLTIVTSPLRLRALGFPAELPLVDPGSSIIGMMQVWLYEYSTALVADSAGPVQWSESSLAPQFDAIYSALFSNSASTLVADEVVCRSSRFQGSHTGTDSCGATVVIEMDWVLVERTRIDGNTIVSSSGIFSPIFQIPPEDFVTESGGNDSLNAFKDWIARKAGAVLAPGYDNLEWNNPNIDWVVQDEIFEIGGCAPSQVCEATFSATDRCGTPFGYTATFTIAPDCISAKMLEGSFDNYAGGGPEFRAPEQATPFPSWNAVDIWTEPPTTTLGSSPAGTSEQRGHIIPTVSSETWGIIAVSGSIIFIAFGIAIWCKRRSEGEGIFNNQPDYAAMTRGMGMGARSTEPKSAARAMQSMYTDNQRSHGPAGGGRRRVQFAPNVRVDGDHYLAPHRYGPEIDYHGGGSAGLVHHEDPFQSVLATRVELEATGINPESQMAAMLGDMDALTSRISNLKARASNDMEWDDEHEGDGAAAKTPYGRANGLQVRISSGQAYPAYPTAGNNFDTNVLFSPSNVASYDLVGSGGIQSYEFAGGSPEGDHALVDMGHEIDNMHFAQGEGAGSVSESV